MKKIILFSAMLLLVLSGYSQTAGTFQLCNTKISKKGTIRPTDINVQRVRVEIINGMIENIYVETDTTDASKPIYTNKRSSISVVRFNEGKRPRRLDKLFNLTSKDTADYIRIGDILCYTPQKGGIPKNTYFTLTPTAKNPKPTHDVESDWLADLDVKVYSDALGIFAQEANGLAQTEASLPFVISTRNVPNKRAVFFNYIKPHFIYSRLDSSKKDYAYNPSVTIADRLGMLQKSPLAVGIDLNIIKAWSKDRLFDFEANLGYQFNLINLFNTDDSTRANAYFQFMVPKLKLNFLQDKFTIAASAPISMIQRKEGILFTEKDRKLQFLTVFSIQANITTIFNPEKKEGFYVRFNQYNNFSQKGSNFIQLQLGYTSSLSDLFGKKDKDEKEE
jgi:hypothetical protein